MFIFFLTKIMIAAGLLRHFRIILTEKRLTSESWQQPVIIVRGFREAKQPTSKSDGYYALVATQLKEWELSPGILKLPC
jgi:hypothetical protein